MSKSAPEKLVADKLVAEEPDTDGASTSLRKRMRRIFGIRFFSEAALAGLLGWLFTLFLTDYQQLRAEETRLLGLAQDYVGAVHQILSQPEPSVKRAPDQRQNDREKFATASAKLAGLRRELDTFAPGLSTDLLIFHANLKMAVVGVHGTRETPEGTLTAFAFLRGNSLR
ncbi:hypothetical protein [Breoghania sp.]|uniref:hypothetical protein n=1 Tax=Breoghania sp. TaxID=2065378 RepID=UPI00260775AC|nr:hypothetical protein [Breoghania sp.]MDJ0932495.1 hypothetical protein [Breoghania sp.]